MLHEILNADLIRLKVQVEDWRGAVRTAGMLMVQAGLCENRYVDAMITAVERLGPYMVLAPGIALAHARPEDGVRRVGLSIVTLAQPVDFGSPANDPVHLVIAFGGVDHSSHVEMLQELAAFLVEDEHQNMLLSATDAATVLTAFSPERSSE